MDVIIVYASMTGTTESMAECIAEELTCGGLTVEMKDAIEVIAEELPDYDLIIIGSYTWGDGDLPDEFLDFFDELSRINLTGKLAAAFGSGDTSYPHFARAVDLWEDCLKERGCTIVQKGLKLDQPNEQEVLDACRLFSKNILDAIHQ